MQVYLLQSLLLCYFVRLTIARRYDNDSNCEKFGSMLIARILKKPFPPEYNDLYKLLQFSGTAIGDLGDYSGCKKLNYSRYFVLTATVDIYKQSIGFCYFKDCDPQYIQSAIHNLMEMANYILPSESKLNTKKLVIRDTDKELEDYRSTSFIGFCIVMSILGLIILLTIIQWIRKDKLLAPFDIRKNLKEYFIKKRRENQTLESLSIINGVKCLTSAWIIFGEMFYIPIYYVKNTASMYYLTKKWFFNFVSGSFFATDVFLFLSGFLFCFSIQKIIKKGNRVGILSSYFSRYLRFLPFLLFMVFFLTYVSPFISSGPNYYLIQTLNNGCKANWWHNMLFINNIVKYDENYKGNNVCVLQIWYLACNMQFYFYAMFIYFFFHDKPIVKYITFALTYIGSIIVQFYTIYYYQFKYNNIQDPSPNDPMFTAYYYVLPWNRINVYIIGIVFCEWFLSTKMYYKDYIKEDDSNTTSSFNSHVGIADNLELVGNELIENNETNSVTIVDKERQTGALILNRISSSFDYEGNEPKQEEEIKQKDEEINQDEEIKQKEEEKKQEEEIKQKLIIKDIPDKRNNDISLTLYEKLNLLIEKNNVVAYALFALGFILINITFWTSYIANVVILSQFMDAFLLTFTKDFFVIGLGLVLHITYMGKLPIIHHFLTLFWMDVYQRATYGIMYLHIFFFFLFFYQYPSIYYMAIGDFIIFSFSILLVSFITSLIIGSLIEKPFNKITSMFFKDEPISFRNIASSKAKPKII